MKAAKKRIMGALMAAVLAISMLSVPVSAKISAPKEVNVYLTDDTSSCVISVSGLSKSQKIKKSSVAVSSKAVAKLSSVFNNTWSEKYYNFSNSRTTNSDGTSAGIEVILHKPGTTKVSYKIGSTKYSTTVHALKYVNPVKSLTIKGVAGGKNLASRAASSNNVSGLSLAKTTSNAIIKVSAKSGWKIYGMSLNESIQDEYYGSTVQSIGVSHPRQSVASTSMKVLKLSKGKLYSLSITFQNKAKGASITVNYSFS